MILFLLELENQAPFPMFCFYRYKLWENLLAPISSWNYKKNCQLQYIIVINIWATFKIYAKVTNIYFQKNISDDLDKDSSRLYFLIVEIKIKKPFLSDQLKEIEENNRMGKTRCLQEN